MIAALSAARALPEAVVERLATRADGVPLFAEELTQAVVEAGGDAAVAEIPVTLQDSLLARLDRIASAKEVAQRAAVLGREFSYPLLAATAGKGSGRKGTERA
jgi:predicted ATPase